MADKHNSSAKTTDSANDKLETEGPISERDEVKKAEDRTRKAQNETNSALKDKKDSK